MGVIPAVVRRIADGLLNQGMQVALQRDHPLMRVITPDLISSFWINRSREKTGKHLRAPETGSRVCGAALAPRTEPVSTAPALSFHPKRLLLKYLRDLLFRVSHFYFPSPPSSLIILPSSDFQKSSLLLQIKWLRLSPPPPPPPQPSAAH